MAMSNADDFQFNISDIDSLPSLGECDDVADEIFTKTIDMDYLEDLLCKLVNENENTNSPDAQVEVSEKKNKIRPGKRGPDKKKRQVKKGFTRPSTGVNRKPYVMKSPRQPRGPYKIKAIHFKK
jgi:hypothetical protein